jgi:hypothetical protein
MAPVALMEVILRLRIWSCALAAALFLVQNATLRAEDDPQQQGWHVQTRQTLGAAVNPIGVQASLERAWSRKLGRSQTPLQKEAHLAFGLAERLTPAYNRVGVWLELAPLSIVEVQVGIEPVVYFGTFKSLLAFDGYAAPFDDDTRDARGSQATSALAGRAYVAPTFKLKLGRVVARGHAELEWWTAAGVGPYFYEPGRDTLLRASGDGMLVTETALLWDAAPGRRSPLYVGAVHDLSHVWAAPRNRKQDAGLMCIAGLGPRLLGLQQPVLYVKLLRHLQDPYRSGQLSAKLALGFSVGRTR